jgi:hypothetical protein
MVKRSSAQPEVPYRVRNRAFILASGLPFVAVTVLIIVLVVSERGDTAPGEWLAFGLVWAVTAMVAWRMGFVSVTVELDHVLVRNTFRRYRIEWADLGEFRPVLMAPLVPISQGGMYHYAMSASTGPRSAVTFQVLSATEDGPTRWSGQIIRRLEAHRHAVMAGRTPGEVYGVMPPIRRYLH